MLLRVLTGSRFPSTSGNWRLWMGCLKSILILISPVWSLVPPTFLRSFWRRLPSMFLSSKPLEGYYSLLLSLAKFSHFFLFYLDWIVPFKAMFLMVMPQVWCIHKTKLMASKLVQIQISLRCHLRRMEIKPAYFSS